MLIRLFAEKAFCNEVDFRRPFARTGRFSVTHKIKTMFESVEQRHLRAALEHFGHEMSARAQNIHGKFRGRFNKRDCLQMIRAFMPRCIGR